MYLSFQMQHGNDIYERVLRAITASSFVPEFGFVCGRHSKANHNR